MDRRHTIALFLGLALCLALLGSWFVSTDQEDASSKKAPAAVESAAPGAPIAEIVQVPRKDPKDGSTVSYEAPMGPGVFRGRVIDALSREPVREFTVELQPPMQSNKPPPQIRQSFRTKDGRFTYRALPTGTWTIFTTAAGYQRFDIPDARISENELPAEVLIPMRAGFALRGRVVDEITSEGLASATISFREASVGRYEDNYQQRPSVRSRKDGSFTVDGVPPGAVRLEVRAGGYVTREIETFAAGQTPPLEIALSKGAMLSGYLAGTDGLTPVQGEVSLANLDENSAMVTSSGPAGEFKFLQLAAGRHLLTGRGGGLSGQREITLAHNEQLEGIVLPMAALHSVRGVVSGLRPDERARATVLVHPIGSNTGMALQSQLDARGAFEVRSVAPGRVLIEAISMRGGRLTREMEMPANGDLTVNLEFKTNARLTGRVTRGGKPLAGATVDTSGMTAEGRFGKSTVTAENGEYAIEEVPDGSYQFRVEAYESATVQVSGDTVFDIDVPEAQLAGRVLEESGKVPLAGAMVDVRPVPLGSHVNRLINRSDHFGRFAIRGLQPGDFVLTAYKPGYELYRAPLSYGSPIMDMAIYMHPARGVEIRVRDADTNKAIGSIVVVETGYGSSGLILELQADQNGVSYLPVGLSGSSLRITAFNYFPAQIAQWNGQQLDLSLQRRPSR